jgi:hypothetical protein
MKCKNWIFILNFAKGTKLDFILSKDTNKQSFKAAVVGFSEIALCFD